MSDEVIRDDHADLLRRRALTEDAALRKALYLEVEDELKKSVPIVVNDPADAELRLKSYLTQKLK